MVRSVWFKVERCFWCLSNVFPRLNCVHWALIGGDIVLLNMKVVGTVRSLTIFPNITFSHFPILLAYWLFTYLTPHCRSPSPLYSVMGFHFSACLLWQHVWKYPPNFIPRLTQSAVHLYNLLFVFILILHLYSTVDLAYFLVDVLCHWWIQHLSQSQGTNTVYLMKFGLAWVMSFHSVLIL